MESNRGTTHREPRSPRRCGGGDSSLRRQRGRTSLDRCIQARTGCEPGRYHAPPRQSAECAAPASKSASGGIGRRYLRKSRRRSAHGIVAAGLWLSRRSLPPMGSCGGACGSGWHSRRASSLRSRAGTRTKIRARTSARRIAGDAPTVSRRTGSTPGQRTAVDELGRPHGCRRGDSVCPGTNGVVGPGERHCSEPSDQCRVHAPAGTATSQTSVSSRACICGTSDVRADG